MQIKNSIDRVTRRKILISFGISLLSAGGGFLGAIGQGMTFKQSAVIALTTGGGFLLAALREYLKGEDAKNVPLDGKYGG